MHINVDTRRWTDVERTTTAAAALHMLTETCLRQRGRGGPGVRFVWHLRSALISQEGLRGDSEDTTTIGARICLHEARHASSYLGLSLKISCSTRRGSVNGLTLRRPAKPWLRSAYHL
jgi:hypothetical protein